MRSQTRATSTISFLHQAFDPDAQRAFSMEVLRRFGYTDDELAARQTAHPFTSTPGQGDIRVTTRWDESYLGSGLFAALHEFGHGLYDDGVDPALERTPLAT